MTDYESYEIQWVEALQAERDRLRVEVDRLVDIIGTDGRLRAFQLVQRKGMDAEVRANQMQANYESAGQAASIALNQLSAFKARADELVAERNAMAAHINQFAEDWQTERDRAEYLQSLVDEIRAACEAVPTIVARKILRILVALPQHLVSGQVAVDRGAAQTDRHSAEPSARQGDASNCGHPNHGNTGHDCRPFAKAPGPVHRQETA